MSSVEGSRQSEELVLEAQSAPKPTTDPKVDAIVASVAPSVLDTIEAEQIDPRLQGIGALGTQAKRWLTRAIVTNENDDVALAAAQIIKDALRTANEEVTPQTVEQMGKEIHRGELTSEIFEALKSDVDGRYVAILLVEYLSNAAGAYRVPVLRYLNLLPAVVEKEVEQPRTWEQMKKDFAKRRLQEKIDGIGNAGIIDSRVLSVGADPQTSALLSELIRTEDSDLLDGIVEGLMVQVQTETNEKELTLEDIADLAEAKLDALPVEDDDCAVALLLLSHKFRIMTGHA